MSPEEISFSVAGNRLAAKRWPNRGSPLILALHGWLDNAASFDNLAPLLKGYEFVALDLAGHGLSDHRSEDSAYNLWQDVGDVVAVIDQLEQSQLILMGHSRGAMIATMTAACYPDKVDKLVLLDGLMPVPVMVEDTVDQLRRAFDDRDRYRRKKLRYYEHYDDAIKSRLHGPLRLSRQAVDKLAARGLGHSTLGYYWRADPRLRGASEFKLTEAHSAAFIRQLTMPALLMLAMPQPAAFQRWLAVAKTMTVERVEGAHHFHLEHSPGEVAQRIRDFL